MRDFGISRLSRQNKGLVAASLAALSVAAACVFTMDATDAAASGSGQLSWDAQFFKRLSASDCRGIASGDKSWCQSSTCRAIASRDKSWCDDSECRGVASGDKSWCESGNCRAVASRDKSWCQ